MTATTGTPGWEDIARTWGMYFTFDYEPDAEKPYVGTRKDGLGTVRGGTEAEFLDRIKDDLTDRPFISPAPEARTGDRL